MSISIGTDIALISRFDNLKSGLEEKIFTPYERREADARTRKSEYFASRFASKEAYVKALGTGFGLVSPSDIEVREDEKGAPYFVVKGERKDNTKLSLSHDGDYAVAFVLIENE